MALNAQYASTPVVGRAVLSAADAGIVSGTSAPTNSVSLLVAGASGTRLSKIIVQGTGTTAAAGIIRLYLYNSTGTTYTLIKEIPTSIATASTTSPVFSLVLSEQYNPDFFPLVIPSTCTLYVTTSVALGFTVTVFGANL